MAAVERFSRLFNSVLKTTENLRAPGEKKKPEAALPIDNLNASFHSHVIHASHVETFFASEVIENLSREIFAGGQVFQLARGFIGERWKNYPSTVEGDDENEQNSAEDLLKFIEEFHLPEKENKEIVLLIQEKSKVEKPISWQTVDGVITLVTRALLVVWYGEVASHITRTIQEATSAQVSQAALSNPSADALFAQRFFYAFFGRTVKEAISCREEGINPAFASFSTFVTDRVNEKDASESLKIMKNFFLVTKEKVGKVQFGSVFDSDFASDINDLCKKLSKKQLQTLIAQLIEESSDILQDVEKVQTNDHTETLRNRLAENIENFLPKEAKVGKFQSIAVRVAIVLSVSGLVGLAFLSSRAEAQKSQAEIANNDPGDGSANGEGEPPADGGATDPAALVGGQTEPVAPPMFVSDPPESTPVNYTELAKSIHIVVPGEWLNKIARENNMTLKELLKLNPHLGKGKPIHAGDRVFLTKEASERYRVDKALQETLSFKRQYKVHAGDTAWGIAMFFGTDLESLATANDTTVAALAKLKIGQILNIP